LNLTGTLYLSCQLSGLVDNIFRVNDEGNFFKAIASESCDFSIPVNSETDFLSVIFIPQFLNRFSLYLNRGLWIFLNISIAEVHPDIKDK